MWPQLCLPPHPMMLEETQQSQLAAAKKKLKEYQQRNSPGVLAGVKTKKKKTGSSPETTTSGGCHSPGDSQNQELEVALDSSSTTINQLYENIESLVRSSVFLFLQEKKANNEINKAQTEQLETINILTLEKADVKTTLYHTKRAARHFEEESKDLAGCLQYSLQRIQELERALSAVSTQQQEEDRVTVLQRQLQQTRKERALLNAHMTQVTESLKQVQLERDEYAQHIKGERARWQERMRKMSVEAHTLKEEKKHHIHRIQELERSLSRLKHQMGKMGLVTGIRGLWGGLECHREVGGWKSFEAEGKRSVPAEHLEAASQQNQQLETQFSLMALPGQGDGGGHLDTEEEGVPWPMLSIPEDLESREVTSSFMDLPREKVDGKQQVENLELGFIQLFGAIDGMREHITVYERPNTRHMEEEASRLAQNEEEMKVEGVQHLSPLPSGEAAGAARYGVAAHSRDPSPPGTCGVGRQEQGRLAVYSDHCLPVSEDFHNSVEPAVGEAREGSPRDNPTAQKILQLLPVMQDT
uniref:Golgin subfamily A conserved domain-containing protein n=1 Tax=Colobus angolensis palliatus TaxID=336983 RepID=A0A2K5ITL1_COLAP